MVTQQEKLQAQRQQQLQLQRQQQRRLQQEILRKGQRAVQERQQKEQLAKQKQAEEKAKKEAEELKKKVDTTLSKIEKGDIKSFSEIPQAQRKYLNLPDNYFTERKKVELAQKSAQASAKKQHQLNLAIRVYLGQVSGGVQEFQNIPASIKKEAQEIAEGKERQRKRQRESYESAYIAGKTKEYAEMMDRARERSKVEIEKDIFGLPKYSSVAQQSFFKAIEKKTPKAPTITSQTKMYQRQGFSKSEATFLAKEGEKQKVSFTPKYAKQIISQQPRVDLSNVGSDFQDVGMGSVFSPISAKGEGLKMDVTTKGQDGTATLLPRGDSRVSGRISGSSYLGNFFSGFSDYYSKGLATETPEFGTAQAKPLTITDEQRKQELQDNIWTADTLQLGATSKEYEKLISNLYFESEQEQQIKLEKLKSIGAKVKETETGFEISPPIIDIIPGKAEKKVPITSFDYDANAFSKVALGTDIITRTTGAVGGKITGKATEKYYKAKGLTDDLDIIRKEFKTNIIQEQYGTQQYDTLTGKKVPFFKPIEVTIPEVKLGERKKQAEAVGGFVGGVAPYFIPYVGAGLFYSDITGSIGSRAIKQGSIIKGTKQFVKEEPFNAIMLGSIGAFKVGKGAVKAYPGVKTFSVKTGKEFVEFEKGLIRDKKGRFSELEMLYKKKKKIREKSILDIDSPLTELFIKAETKRAGEYEKLLGELRKAKNTNELKKALSKFKGKKLSEFEKAELQRLTSQKTFEITGQDIIFTNKGYFISGKARTGVKSITKSELSILNRIKIKPIQATQQNEDVINIMGFGLKTKQKQKTKQITKMQTLTKPKIETAFSQLILQGQLPAQKTSQSTRTTQSTFNKIITGIPTQTIKVPKPPKVPKFPFDFEFKKEKPMVNPKEPTDVFVKSGGKFKKVTKNPVQRGIAKDMGFYITDQTLSRQFKLKKAKGEAKKPSFKVPKSYGRIYGYKFRPYKVKKGKKKSLVNQYIEKKYFIGDTKSELQRLNVKKFLAQQQKQTQQKDNYNKRINQMFMPFVNAPKQKKGKKAKDFSLGLLHGF